MMSLQRVTHPCAALLLCLTAVTLRGQQRDGFSVRERAGVALVKPQPWSKDSEATVLEFKAFINRTADGTSGAGYYEFRTTNADRRQVPVGRIVKLIVYPDAQEFSEIVSPQDRRALISRAEEMKAVVAKFPASRSRLHPSLKKLSEELAKYDSGEVKTDGVWLPRQAFEKSKAVKLASLLKADIARAKPPSSLDLDNDPKFIGLKELAEGNSDAKSLATELSALFEGLLRAEKRSVLLARLSSSGTSLAEAEDTLNQLKALQPEEDPKSAANVKIWDSGIATIRTTSGEAEKISRLLEREVAGFGDGDSPPEISPELARRFAATSVTIARFLAGKPPVPLAGAVRQAEAVCAAGANLQKLKPIFEEKRYMEAKDILDDLARDAGLFGPETTRTVSDLKRQVVGKIEEFTRLRGEAKLLAESGKKTEALAKFEAAFSVIPDSEVGEQIAQLKQDLTAAPQKVQ
ncbi:MAG TPA: hypothetical protein VIS71_10495 [Terrimicrobium sp.]